MLLFSVLTRIIHSCGNLLSTNGSKIIRPLLTSNYCTAGPSQDANATSSDDRRAEESADEESMKMKIFTAALPLVPQLGWSKECLEAGKGEFFIDLPGLPLDNFTLKMPLKSSVYISIKKLFNINYVITFSNYYITLKIMYF